VIVAATGGGAGVASVLIWVGLLMGLVLVGSVVVLQIRRRLLANDDTTNPGGLMEDLRASVRRGEMTQEEYDATVRAIALKMRGQDPGTSDTARRTGKPDTPNGGADVC
jgi:uncharacterized membrane protein